ncbi:MAG: MBL fold metallo-hydrolase [Phenylobacterium sp.]|uniref:MBL fold metallo-hydrolase n=1 Tax=Phenylobacterium sp. TaxID=1871053 RepID=UPI0025EB52AC|nr:MBL fold metallo-hydrolase [Phenylobacterium sp.]MBI1197035.1 MBL fold metallo-hydrolase [Phenylobacterium sp.]
MRITKVVITIYALLFALLGVGFWVAPELLAARFNIVALGVPGFSTLRGDMGGMFFALSALCLVGLWTGRRAPLMAAALALSAVIVGRLLGWAVTGSPAGLAANLPIEIGAVVVLALHVRGQKDPPAEPVPTGRIARNAAIWAGGAAAVAAVMALALHSPAIQDRMFAAFVRQNVGRDNSALLGDDALRVATCGTSAPLPSLARAKACVAVMAGGKIYIVDSGPESTKNLMLWGLPLDRVAGVMITHFHSDHIGDLGELNLQTWVPGRPAPLAVYGGPGIEQVVAGFNEAYTLDEGYRTAHHTAELMPPATAQMIAHTVTMPEVPGPGGVRSTVVLDDGSMKVTAIETNHAPARPAYAYRFDFKGRSAVITGDTTNYAPLAVASSGTDILVSEALNREMIRTLEQSAREKNRPRVAHIMRDIQSYHISPTEAADMANKAGARLLVLYHLLPAPDNGIAKEIFARGLDSARHGGKWDLADDGSLYTLPVGSTAFEIGRVPQ